MERETNSNFHFPLGFRFHPYDEELIIHYLQNKVTSRPLSVSLIAEIDLYKYNPWELPKKALFGEDEWYFFSPGDIIQMEKDQTELQLQLIGRLPVPTSLKSLLLDQRTLESRKHWSFTMADPPKGVKTVDYERVQTVGQDD
ncbi:hypothetical protein CRYUN_Cryun11dG0092100 [Craigia yunnanensis]